MVDPRDLGLVTQVRSPHAEEPTIYLYEAVPGGIGLSERLWERHDELLAGAADLIAACGCDGGCPACTGPAPRARRRRARRSRCGCSPSSAPARRSVAIAVTGDRPRRRPPRSAGSRTTGRRPGPRPSPAPGDRPAIAPTGRARVASSAERLAAAVDGEVVRTPGRLRRPRRAGRRSILPLDRERLATPARPATGGTRRSSASTPRRPGSRRRRAPSPSSSGSAGGRATGSARSSCCCPTTPTEPALLDEVARHIPRRCLARDVQRPRLRLAAARRRATGWPAGRPRRTPATSTCCRSSGGCSAIGWTTPASRTVERSCSGVVRHDDVDGWEIPGRYLGFLRGGPAQPLAAVVRHNDEDVRSLARLLVRLEHDLGDPAVRRGAAGRSRRARPGVPARASARGGRRVPRCCPAAEPATEPAADPPVVSAGPRRGCPRSRGGRRAGAPTSAAAAARARTTGWTGAGVRSTVGRDADRRGSGAPAAPPRPSVEALEAWESLAHGPGRIAIVAAIEAAKLREHRLAISAVRSRASSAAPLADRRRSARDARTALEPDLRHRWRRLRGKLATLRPPSAAPSPSGPLGRSRHRVERRPVVRRRQIEHRRARPGVPMRATSPRRRRPASERRPAAARRARARDPCRSRSRPGPRPLPPASTGCRRRQAAVRSIDAGSRPDDPAMLIEDPASPPEDSGSSPSAFQMSA